MLLKTIILLSVLVVLYTLELLFPYFEWSDKGIHTVRNFAIIAFNAIVINLLFVPLLVLVTDTSWGLFNTIDVAPLLELIMTIIILDLLSYSLHVLYHKVPFFWRFHRMHHSDIHMDVTSGARFHIGEHIASIIGKYAVYALFAMKLEFIIIYETLFIVNVLFHHANISVPFDKAYRLLLTSPDMHKVHHSIVREEADSNYTSLLSFWDRLFGTYKIIDNPKRITYGVKGLEDEQTVTKMLLTPFNKNK